MRMAPSTPSREITPRENYHDLTDKMKAVVDALAENPDAGHTEIARLASDKLDGDSVSRSYIPAIKDRQEKVIEQRRETLANKRFEGEERTEGDPFEGLGLSESGKSWQRIQDRPVKSVEASDDGDSKPKTQSLDEALENAEIDSEANGDRDRNGSAQEVEVEAEEPEPEPEPVQEPAEPAEPKRLTLELSCPDMELWGGRIVLSAFRTAVGIRIGA